MKAVMIHTLDGKVYNEQVESGYTSTPDAQEFEDIWGQPYVTWKGSSIHNVHGPAVIYDGYEQYWYAGIRYKNKELWEKRKALDSYVNIDGERCWHKVGAPHILHRDDGGPAKESKKGFRRWYINGKLHRENGPAIIYPSGHKHWYLNGLRHRENGPAIELDNGEHYWYKNGHLHREDGPAIELADGSKRWYENGLRHRIGGPAHISANGDQFWYERGKRHRTDGPAVEKADGTREWWTEGKIFCREANKQIEYFDDKCRLHSPFPSIPAFMNDVGDSFWYKEGKLHRLKEPAVILHNGQQEWYQDDLRHNEDGPAIIYASGRRAWYVNGKRLTKAQFESFKKESKSKDVKNNMGENKNSILYLIYSATYKAYKANMEKNNGTHAYYGGFLKSKYAGSKIVSANNVHDVMAFATMSAEAGHALFDSKEFDSILDGLLKSSAFMLSDDNPYDVYRLAWAILNINREAPLTLLNSDFSKAIDIANDDIGRSLRTVEDFEAEYFPKISDLQDKDESSWTGPAFSILMAAAVGALVKKTSKKTAVKKTEKKQVQVVTR